MAEETFNEHEMRLLKNAWKCMETEPKINYTELAAAMGMTNVRSASNAWSKVKQKLKFSVVNSIEPGETPKSSAKSSAKKRNKATIDDDNEETPTKKVKKETKAKPKKAKKNATPEMTEEDRELLYAAGGSDDEHEEHVKSEPQEEDTYE